MKFPNFEYLKTIVKPTTDGYVVYVTLKSPKMAKPVMLETNYTDVISENVIKITENALERAIPVFTKALK